MTYWQRQQERLDLPMYVLLPHPVYHALKLIKRPSQRWATRYMRVSRRRYRSQGKLWRGGWY